MYFVIIKQNVTKNSAFYSAIITCTSLIKLEKGQSLIKAAKQMFSYVDLVYPNSELEIKDPTEYSQSAFYLDIY
jgi:hypothetical protein